MSGGSGYMPRSTFECLVIAEGVEKLSTSCSTGAHRREAWKVPGFAAAAYGSRGITQALHPAEQLSVLLFAQALTAPKPDQGPCKQVYEMGL